MSPQPKGRSQSRAEQEELLASRLRERRVFAIVAAALVVVFLGAGIAFQSWRTSRAPSAVPAAASDSAGFAPVTLTSGKPILLGRANAPLVIALYEDFHCGHCADFEEEFGPTLAAAQQTGTVAVELYPMAFIDDGSRAASNAMACAAEAGFGQGYYRALFANASLRWSSEQLTTLAEQVTGGAPASFDTCVTTAAHADWVQSINTAADANGVTQTPTMFVDNQRVDIATVTPASLNTMISEAASK